MADYDYQYGFSEAHSEEMYDVAKRTQKAYKMLSVLDDYYSGELASFSLLDIGCSTGIISTILCQRLARVVGIDIDEEGIKYAKENNHYDNLEFYLQDGINLEFPEESFDVVICAHIYEHVPDSKRLMSEIYRILKPGGVCYFAAGNRLNVIEPHYKLPFLSIIPKLLANHYLRLLKKGKFYYEKHQSLWGLRDLVSNFEVMDYTIKIIEDPQKYHAAEMIRPGSFKHKLSKTVLRNAYWLCPTYIWLLCKKGNNKRKLEISPNNS